MVSIVASDEVAQLAAVLQAAHVHVCQALEQLAHVDVNQGIKVGETTPDKKFTLGRAECLASCGTAPMLQLNHDGFYENLTPESTLKLIEELSSRGD